MPRINIDDKLIGSAEFITLAITLGSKIKAMGTIVFALKKAQEYCLNEETKGLIPAEEYKKIDDFQLLYDIGFFEIIDNNFYRIKDHYHHFGWLIKCSDGGKANSKKKSQLIESTIENKKKKTLEDPCNSLEDPCKGEQALTPSPTPSPFQNEYKKENITKEKTLQQVVGDSDCGVFTLDKEVSTQDIELLYAKYPRKEGKTKGMQKLQKQIKTKQDLADLAKAIEVYSKLSAGKEKQFIKHFATFASCWKDYLQEGIESDNKPVKQDDNLLNSFSEKWSQS